MEKYFFEKSRVKISVLAATTVGHLGGQISPGSWEWGTGWGISTLRVSILMLRMNNGPDFGLLGTSQDGQLGTPEGVQYTVAIQGKKRQL